MLFSLNYKNRPWRRFPPLQLSAVMALSLSRVPSLAGVDLSPNPNLTTASATRQGAEPDVDLLASTLHHALQNTTPHHAHHHDRQDSASSRKEDKPTNIEIIVDSDVLTLRGTGVDVAPALLSGQVALNLAESTPVKQITLQLRGKAKLPPVENEMYVPWLSPVSHKGVAWFMY